MQEEQDQNAKEDFTNSNKKISPNPIQWEETPTYQTKTDDQKKDTGTVKQEPYNIIINVPEIKDKAATISNFISFVNVLVAATLAIFTSLLFKQATKDSQTAEDAAKSAKISSNAAVQAVKEQHIIYLTDSINKSKTFIRDSINNKNNFDISKNTLQIQIHSLKQTQNEFEAENRSFLEITGVNIDTLAINKHLQLTFKIQNIGKSPAQIINGFYYFLVYDTTKHNVKHQIFSKALLYSNIGISYTFTSGILLGERAYKEAINSNKVYMHGQLKYKSLMTNKIYLNTFEYSITYFPYSTISSLENDEVETK